MRIALTRKLLFGIVVLPVFLSGAAIAQVIKPEAYLVDDRGVPARNTSILGNLCWHTSDWTPAKAIYECEPDLVIRPEKGAKAAAPAAATAAAAKTAPEKATLSADTLFDFDKAVLKPEGMQALDDLIRKLAGIKYDLIIAVGYADRIGTEEYNKGLSVRRAEAVKHYLVTHKGIDPSNIFTDGKGEANPVTGDTCKGDKKTKALIDCLQPDRRVEIEVAGTREAK
jgi:OOP family OmpA-OmpF porin